MIKVLIVKKTAKNPCAGPAQQYFDLRSQHSGEWELSVVGARRLDFLTKHKPDLITMDLHTLCRAWTAWK